MKKMVALDLGGSGGKMFLGRYDGRALSLSGVHRFHNEPLALGGGLYWDFLGIYQNLLEGVRSALAQAGGGVDSLGVDSYCNDFALVNARGDVTTQMRCYRDARTLRNEDAIYKTAPPAWLHARTGNQTAPFSTLMQLAAMELEKEGYLLEKGRLLHLPDLVGFLLTGRAHSEFSIASVTQMLSLQSGGWDYEIFDRFGIPHGLVAPVVQPGTLLGPLTAGARAHTGLPPLQVATVCHHDTASAVAALPTTQPGAVFISSGTWSLVGTLLDAPFVNEATLRYNLALEGGVGGQYRLLRNVMGLWLVQQCRREFALSGADYSYADLEALAWEVPAFRSLIDPDEGLYFSPGNMRQKIAARCAETGQPVPQTPGEVVRCIVESLALKYRWAIHKLELATGRTLGPVHIVGGGGKDGMLSQFTANATGLPVYVGPLEAAATGNLLMQLVASGELESPLQGREMLAATLQLKEYQPQHAAHWQQQYERFLALYPGM